jgi:uncharacterized integral membrane protein (TIGR00698 family)
VNHNQLTKTIFFLALILAASGVLSPALALLCGIACGLFNLHPYAHDTHSLSRHLLQGSVVALGFGMNLHQVVAAGRSGLVYTALSITVTLLLGLLLGWLLRIHQRVAFLVSVGTAICGGSAIAAVSPILAATQEEIAVSLGTIFVLNSVALLAFPPIGSALHLSQNQFGLWSALAIHDTSSVVGAAARYGAAALAIATTVKLARALWIVPVSLCVSVTRKSPGGIQSRVQLPWFIVFFLLAAAANTFLPFGHPAYDLCRRLGLTGLTVTLFLIGASLSVKTLRAVGPRPLLQGILLWIAVATGSLFMIRANWIQ